MPLLHREIEEKSKETADWDAPKSERSIRVLVVDDHPLTRIGVASIISRQPNMTVVGHAGSARRAVLLFQELRPDLIVMDLRLPDASGVVAIREIRRIDPSAKIIVLTTYGGDEDIHQALGAGALGYLIKGMSHQELIRALHRVYAGNRFIPRAVNEALAMRTSESLLTKREQDVLNLMFHGKSNREIAEELQLRETTVKTHIREILTRLNVRDRTQAVVEGLKRGLIHL